jgi:ribosomal protein L2
MNKFHWKGKPFKTLSFGKTFFSGRNFSGQITIFHRGGGSKKLLRRIDFQRKNQAWGFVERVEYDPNRTARIALVRWSDFKLDEFTNNVSQQSKSGRMTSFTLARLTGPSRYSRVEQDALYGDGDKLVKQTVQSGLDDLATAPRQINPDAGLVKMKRSWFHIPAGARTLKTLEASRVLSTKCSPEWNQNTFFPLRDASKTAVSYILAWDKVKPGDEILNFQSVQDASAPFSQAPVKALPKVRSGRIFNLDSAEPESSQSTLQGGIDIPSEMAHAAETQEHLYQKNGISLPLWLAPLGCAIHNIELHPGYGGQLARAAGTSAQLVKKSLPEERASNLCVIRFPSGQQQSLDSRCRATIGIVSNIDHGARKLGKAGVRRWLGFRPVVRGVAMNPIDHPHGGRTKGGRPSVSPWGKPTKCGFGNLRLRRQKKK